MKCDKCGGDMTPCQLFTSTVYDCAICAAVDFVPNLVLCTLRLELYTKAEVQALGPGPYEQVWDNYMLYEVCSPIPDFYRDKGQQGIGLDPVTCLGFRLKPQSDAGPKFPVQ